MSNSLADNYPGPIPEPPRTMDREPLIVFGDEMAMYVGRAIGEHAPVKVIGEYGYRLVSKEAADLIRQFRTSLIVHRKSPVLIAFGMHMLGTNAHTLEVAISSLREEIRDDEERKVTWLGQPNYRTVEQVRDAGRFNSVMKRYVESRKDRFVCVPWDAHEFRTPDGLHYTPEGYREIAAFLMRSA